MNHLKIYEDFSERFYHSIDEVEYYKFTSDSMSFTDNQIKTIKTLFKVSYTFANVCEDIFIRKSSNNKDTFIYLNKCEDEYYLVKVIIRLSNPVSFIRRFYLCDQFDGLISFLEDMKSNNFSFVNFI